jgi:hypothetical protein
MVIIGSMSENSEDDQGLTHARNKAGDSSQTVDSTSHVTTSVAEGELQKLRNRVVTLEQELKVRT